MLNSRSFVCFVPVYFDGVLLFAPLLVVKTKLTPGLRTELGLEFDKGGNYLAALAGVDTVVEPRGLVPTHAT